MHTFIVLHLVEPEKDFTDFVANDRRSLAMNKYVGVEEYPPRLAALSATILFHKTICYQNVLLLTSEFERLLHSNSGVSAGAMTEPRLAKHPYEHGAPEALLHFQWIIVN